TGESLSKFIGTPVLTYNIQYIHKKDFQAEIRIFKSKGTTQILEYLFWARRVRIYGLKEAVPFYAFCDSMIESIVSNKSEELFTTFNPFELYMSGSDFPSRHRINQNFDDKKTAIDYLESEEFASKLVEEKNTSVIHAFNQNTRLRDTLLGMFIEYNQYLPTALVYCQEDDKVPCCYAALPFRSQQFYRYQLLVVAAIGEAFQQENLFFLDESGNLLPYDCLVVILSYLLPERSDPAEIKQIIDYFMQDESHVAFIALIKNPL
ncbi:unnamed protein product, partial [marine sediment metagenome]